MCVTRRVVRCLCFVYCCCVLCSVCWSLFDDWCVLFAGRCSLCAVIRSVVALCCMLLTV